MKKSTWWVIAVIVVIVIILVAANKKSGENGPIKIGFIGPLTGDAANIGQNARAAVEIAVKEVNDTGGINGRNLEVIYEDGKCNGTAAAAANKLIGVDKVPVILGGACSGETSSFASFAEQTKTTVLSYCSSAPALTNAGDYIFRDYPSDTFQGSFAAHYLIEKLGKKKVAVMYIKSDWGVGIKEVFKPEFMKLGGTIVAEEGYEQTTKDLRSQLTKIKSANPDAVYFLGYTEASIPALKQARDIGLKTTWLGGDGWDDPRIWTETGLAGEGAMYTMVASEPSDTFKAAMLAKVGNNEIATCTPTAYDGLKILTQVMKKVGTNSDSIKDELYKTVYVDGVASKEIKFDSNGDVFGAKYIVKIAKDGKAVELK